MKPSRHAKSLAYILANAIEFELGELNGSYPDLRYKIRSGLSEGELRCLAEIAAHAVVNNKTTKISGRRLQINSNLPSRGK